MVESFSLKKIPILLYSYRYIFPSEKLLNIFFSKEIIIGYNSFWNLKLLIKLNEQQIQLQSKDSQNLLMYSNHIIFHAKEKLNYVVEFI